jgi:hypothetical protein
VGVPGEGGPEVEAEDADDEYISVLLRSVARN